MKTRLLILLCTLTAVVHGQPGEIPNGCIIFIPKTIYNPKTKAIEKISLNSITCKSNHDTVLIVDSPYSGYYGLNYYWGWGIDTTVYDTISISFSNTTTTINLFGTYQNRCNYYLEFQTLISGKFVINVNSDLVTIKSKYWDDSNGNWEKHRNKNSQSSDSLQKQTAMQPQTVSPQWDGQYKNGEVKFDQKNFNNGEKSKADSLKKQTAVQLQTVAQTKDSLKNYCKCDSLSFSKQHRLYQGKIYSGTCDGYYYDGKYVYYQRVYKNGKIKEETLFYSNGNKKEAMFWNRLTGENKKIIQWDNNGKIVCVWRTHFPYRWTTVTKYEEGNKKTVKREKINRRPNGAKY